MTRWSNFSICFCTCDCRSLVKYDITLAKDDKSYNRQAASTPTYSAKLTAVLLLA